MRAVIQQADGTVRVEEREVPKLADDAVLIKVKAVGQNPADFQLASINNAGEWIGLDCAGVIEQIGNKVSTNANFKKGSRVCAFDHNGPTSGAFAEYRAVDYNLVMKLPDSLSFEDAAAIPFFTAVQFLFERLKLPEPTAESSLPLPPTNKYLLVWSGASSVGQYAVQLAKVAGMKVITTASESNWPLLKEYGADICLSYKDDNVVQSLKGLTTDSIELAIDCVGTLESNQAICKAMSTAKGGKFVTVEAMQDGAVNRNDVEGINSLLGTALTGKDANFGPDSFPAGPNDVEAHRKWVKLATRLFEEKHCRPVPIRVFGGLEDVQAGFEEHRKGLVRGQKLVYVV